jgi:short-subunit dehydrogenase
MILGGTSGIARAVAAEFARHGYGLMLVARRQEELETVAADLRVRYAVPVQTALLDALDESGRDGAIDAALQAVGDSLAGVVLAIGYLGDQKQAESDWAEARRILDTNFTSSVALLNRVANHMEPRGRGFIAAISSVAGDRGRQSNYFYGSAKAALSTYLSGLRNRLAPRGVRVVTIKPGFVDTPMTYGKPGMFLVASPEAAARGIVKAIRGGRDVAYVPGFWAIIMGIIRAIPEPIFKKLKL